MNWRRAISDDMEPMTRFLADRIETAMFPLANLANHGLNGTEGRAMQFWVLERAERLAGLCGISLSGMLMPVAPDATPRDWAALRPLLADRQSSGILGDAAQVAALRTAFDLPLTSADHTEVEPLFTLGLQRFEPQVPGNVRLVAPDSPIRCAHMIAMRRVYLVETLGSPPDKAAVRAEREVEGYIEQDSHRLLLIGDDPVAMTGFNATWQDVVQIGGVFTPPALRGRGHARHAVALHLEQARQDGASRAQLFAANAPAIRVYRALGFEEVGAFALMMFAEPKGITCR